MWQGAILSHLGLQEEARASLLAALEMNPDDAFSLAFIGLTFLGTGDYDGADDFIARALRLDRASLYAHLFRPVAALYRGIDESMTRAIQEARSTVGDDPLFQMCEAVQLARDGRAARARAATTAALKARSIVHTHHTTHLAGAVFAILGDRARAVAMLRKASKTGLPNYSGFRDDRLLTPLHGYKPFQQLLAGLQREVDAYSREIVSAAVIRPATGSH
jgi:tetratricopeptide (TPR) repeat protein